MKTPGTEAAAFEVGRGSSPEASPTSHAGPGYTSRLSLLWANRGLVFSLVIFGAVILGPFVTPMSPLRTSTHVLVGPSLAHPLGTDTLGRDVLSRLLDGGYHLVAMALITGLASVALGTAIGLVSGYRSGITDTLLMRFVDILLAFPPMLVILLFASVFPRNDVVLIILASILLLPGAARVIRGLTQEIANRDFVAAAEAAGDRTVSVLVREIVPNVRGRLAVEVALRTGFAVLLIASLNFLGVGVSPPTPDWGLSVFEERVAITIAPWATLFPAFAIFLTIAATNSLADWLDRRWA